MAIKKSSSSGIPFGNSAGRPASPGIGQLYSNGEEKRLELYTSSGWQNIVSETPGVVSVSGNYLESVGSATLEITGTNFTTGAIASVIGTNGVEINATSTTVNSIVSVSASFTGLIAANEPYDLKVTNTSNLFGLLPDAIYVNNILSWQTAAGSLGSFGEQVSVSVSATAIDDSTLTYSLASGSSLPSGVTLNSATGLISGTLPDITANTTYSFTINASDGLNPVVPRTFSISSNVAPTWVTAAGSLGTFNEGSSLNLTVAATDVSDTVSYALNSGSSLPSGVTLNSSTGVISGTLPDITTDTTYTFTINASDGVNAVVARTFSITSKLLIPVEYLLVAGGGGGGGGITGDGASGGGGAGGLLYGNKTFTFSASALLTVGTGGSGGLGLGSGGSSYALRNGTNGTNSVLDNLTSIGGGAGKCQDGSSGNSGGSGGGGAGGGSPLPGAGGSGTSGQGNAGGAGQNSPYGGGGGGGAGSAGGSNGGSGGAGLSYSITGQSLNYAGGGGSGSNQYNVAGGFSGGSGVGGNGASGVGVGGTGATNTGSGGGAGGGNGNVGSGGSGGAGANGVVIIAYPNTYPAITTIPGTLTYDQPTRAGYRVYRFTAGSGTVTF